MNRILAGVLAAGAACILMAHVGCSENVLLGQLGFNMPPEVWLSSGPVEGDTTAYKVHFYWGGWDPDGEIRHFEFVVVPGNPFGFNRQDTTGLDKWRRTASYDSVFKVSASDSPRTVSMSGSLYTRYDMTHTFFLRAVDTQGKRSDPAYRSFTAWTLAPYVTIDRPRPPASGTVATLARVITFCWTGRDPIDSPDNVQDPDSVRWLYSQLVNPQGFYDPTFDIVADLNAHPERYESKWGPWIWYRAPGDSGRCAILGDDEMLEMNRSHIFAVQAKDEAGAVTGIFDRRSNVRQFIVSLQAGPLLTICESYLGCARFLGTSVRPEKYDLPPGITLKFRWSADASSYGGEVVCYQYGWDVSDLNNPDDWDSDCSPFVRGCSETWYSGVHTLFVRVVDNAGTETLGQIEINVVPFLMDRNLLWVDDFPSSNFTQTDYAMPTETEHDQFWLGHCAKAVGFDPTRDVYDAHYNYNSRPPLISLIGRYRNIIWTYSSSRDSGCWDDVILFTPESYVGQGTRLTINYLSIFLSKGGHLLTEGRSERGGGLAAGLLPGVQIFPINLRCEITGPAEGCAGDTSGVNMMAYKDYCVTVLDKVIGAFRTGADVPRRSESLDAMRFARLDRNNAVTSLYPSLPDSLGLWEEVVKAGRFFDPRVRGFTFVELYNPAYWMNAKFIKAQGCFHPMYRMRSRSTASPVDNAAAAIWITKYQDVDPDEMGTGIAAPSVHFGFELWYFNRAAVDAIINTVFERWGIRAP